jgi:hypothetical protein
MVPKLHLRHPRTVLKIRISARIAMVAPKTAAELAEATKMSTNGLPIDFDPTDLDFAKIIKTPQNTRLYQAIQNLKMQFNELVEYQLAHPKISKPTTREEIDNEKKVLREISAKEKQVRVQLSLVKALYRQGILRVREEKAKTADDRAVDDALILGLHNLKYEEQSLRSEIAAAENYECVHSTNKTLASANVSKPQIHEAPSDTSGRVPREVPTARGRHRT